MTTTDSESGSGWKFLTPELPVRDPRAAQAYYRDVFGCKIAWLFDESFGAVYHGRVEIFLSRTDEPIEPSSIYVRVDDADRELERLRERGANVVVAIASQPWGMREFVVEDPDGNRLRIGHSEGPVTPTQG